MHKQSIVWICVLSINRNSFPPGMGFILCIENQGVFLMQGCTEAASWGCQSPTHKFLDQAGWCPNSCTNGNRLCPEVPVQVPIGSSWWAPCSLLDHNGTVRGAQRRAVLPSLFGKADRQCPFPHRGITESEDTHPTGNGLSRQFSIHSLKKQILWFCFGWGKTDYAVCQGQGG